MNRVWAIAWNLVREVLRMRFFLFFLILVTFGYTIGFSLWLHGADSMADEKVKFLLSYSVRSMFGLLSLVTIFVSIAAVSREIKRKEIFTVTTKPVRRGEILLGKFLGMALLHLLLVGANGVLIYGCARVLQRTEPDSELEKAKLQELVFVARRSVKPPVPDVSREVEDLTRQQLELKKQELGITDAETESHMKNIIRREIGKQLLLYKGAVPPGGSITWKFSGIEPRDRENGFVFIRYKQEVSYTPESLATDGIWQFGPEDPTLAGGQWYSRRNAIRTVHEFPVPVREVSAEGDLYVTYRNPVSNDPVSVIYPPDTGIEVLYAAGGFEANFLRALLVMYLSLLILSVWGIAAGAWLSFPVAVLFVFMVYLFGLSSNFIVDALEMGTADRAQKPVIKAILPVFPQISDYHPVDQIEKGRYVSWYFWDNITLVKDLAIATVVALIGFLIFKFRELARVIV